MAAIEALDARRADRARPGHVRQAVATVGAPSGIVSAAMTADELRAACLALPGAREERPFSRAPDLTTFKVGGKVFAISRLGGSESLRVSLKCEPELAVGLRAEYPAIPARLPPRQAPLEHGHARRLAPGQDGRDMIEDSYDLVFARLPKARQAEIR